MMAGSVTEMMTVQVLVIGLLMKDKVKGGLKYLVDEVNKLGMKFGIWFEPEMISPDSKLYEKHPEWAIQIKGRTPSLCRNQYVLDLSRKDVRDYVYEQVSGILKVQILNM